MKITIDKIKEYNPCTAGIEKFESQYPNYNDSLESLLKLEDVSYGDKIWLVCKVVDVDILKQWSVDCAEFVVDNYNKEYPKDTRVTDCIETTKLYLEGKCSSEELNIARSAARSAARPAAESATWSAWSATWSAGSASESATWSAESATWSARSAARSAWSAEESARKEQEDINLSLLIGLL